MKNIPVHQIMEHDPVTVRQENPLTELVRVLTREKVRGLPVVDTDNALIGVVTETDLFLKEKGVPFSLERVPSLLGTVIDKSEMSEFELCKRVTVGEVMTRQVAFVAPDATLEDVAMLMLQRHLSLIPVVAHGRLTGVVRRYSVLREIYSPAG